MSNQGKPYFRLVFLIQWIFNTTLGWGLGLLASVGLEFAAGAQMGWRIGTAASFFLLGLFIGISQWFVLRRHLRGAGWWLLVTALGFIAGSFMGTPVSSMMRLSAVAEWTGLRVTGVLTGFAVIGLTVGVLQWFVLQRWVFRAVWWILMETAGIVFSVAVAMAVDLVLSTAAFPDWVNQVVFFGVIGMISGAISGLVLVSLLKRPVAGMLKV